MVGEAFEHGVEITIGAVVGNLSLGPGSRALFTDREAGSQHDEINGDFLEDFAGRVEEVERKRKVQQNLITAACERDGGGRDGTHE